MDYARRLDVGIDCIALYLPPLYVEMKEFEEYRGLKEGSVTEGLGQKRMAVPDARQDPVVFGTNAALRLMRDNHIEPKEIGRLDIATESAVDQSKPLGAFIAGNLEKFYGSGSFSNVVTGERKFACIGGLHGILDTADWITGPRSRGRYGIVVATDDAYYGLGKEGEPTQGAGAVAMLVKEKPRLLRLDGICGVSFHEDVDFFRPNGCETPILPEHIKRKNPNEQRKWKHYSRRCYLNSLREAFDNYKDVALENTENRLFTLGEGKCLIDDFKLMAFHTPFTKMAEYAASRLFLHEWRNLPRFKEIEKEIGSEPSIGVDANGENFDDMYDDYTKKFRATEPFKKDYRKKVAPTTTLSEVVGNSYTASLFQALISAFVSTKERDLTDARIGLGGYGSGRQAIVTSGVVPDGYREVVDVINAQKILDGRKKISMETYEALRSHRQKEGICQLEVGEFYLKEIDADGRRIYVCNR